MPSVSSPARRVLPMTGLDKLIVGSFATFLVIGIFVDWIKSDRRRVAEWRETY